MLSGRSGASTDRPRGSEDRYMHTGGVRFVNEMGVKEEPRKVGVFK